MPITLAHTAIPLNNPFALLDGEDSTPKPTLTRSMTDDWSVVNSAYTSDNEDNGDSDEIYTWQQTNLDGSPMDPLALTAKGDGFTDISKATTASSINNAAVDHWVLKVTKKKRQPRKPKATLTLLDQVPEGSESDQGTASDEEEDEGMTYMSFTEQELSKSARAVQLKNQRLATKADKQLYADLGIANKKVASKVFNERRIEKILDAKARRLKASVV